MRQLESAAADNDEEAEATLDTEFHMAIVEAAGNVVAIQVARSLLDLLRRGIGYSRGLVFDDAEGRAKLLDQHRAIAMAIDAGDALKARKAMHGHLDFVIQRLQRHRMETAARTLAQKRKSWEEKT